MARGAIRAGSGSRNTSSWGGVTLSDARGWFSSSVEAPPSSISVVEFFHPQSLCQAHDKAGFCVCMFLLSVLEKLRYSRHVCQQPLPSAGGGCRATATDVPGLSHRRGRQLWARAEGPRGLGHFCWKHVCMCVCTDTPFPPLGLRWFLSLLSPLTVSSSPFLPILPSSPPIIPTCPHPHSSPSFSLGLTKPPGKGRDASSARSDSELPRIH